MTTPIKFENLLIRSLFKSKDICEKALPFIDVDIFDLDENKKLLKTIKDFEETYKKFPNLNELKIKINNEDLYKHLNDIINDESEYDEDFIKDELEGFIKKKKFYNTLIHLSDKGVKENDFGLMNKAPEMLSEVNGFTFNKSIGFDLFEETDAVYDSLNEVKNYISSGLKSYDKYIGGFDKKTVTLFLAGTHVGKTLTKCAIASNVLMQNKNVLYISVEEHREKIAKVIMSNLLDIKQDDLKFLTRNQFNKLTAQVYEQIGNKIVIESRAPSSMCSNDIKAFIKDLREKKKFFPDIVFIDYIKNLLPNNFQKMRAKHDNLEEIAKELRQVAIDMDLPLVTSQQLNRAGYNISEAELGDIGDSFGITQPMDVILIITRPEGFKEENKYMFDIKKNRNKYVYEKFVLDVEGEKCRLIDSEEELIKLQNDSKKVSTAEMAGKTLINRKLQNLNDQKKQIIDINMDDN